MRVAAQFIRWRVSMRAMQGTFDAGMHTLVVSSRQPALVTLSRAGQANTFELVTNHYDSRARLVVRRNGQAMLSRTADDGAAVYVELRADGSAQVP